MNDDTLNLPGLDDLPAGHRSGFVAVIGRPNVGKSTLMNAYLGEKVAIVSPKPQTTRIRQLGILTLPEAQIIFVDTPGIHAPRHQLGEFMVETATRALADADLILFVVDLSTPPTDEDRRIAALAQEHAPEVPVLIAMNKLDLVPVELLTSNVAAFQELYPQADWTTCSATTGQGHEDLLKRIVQMLPEGPRYYPADQLSDAPIREIAAEIVREKALLRLHEEVPHSVAVVVEEFKERSDNLTYISATIYVERESQKGILIGKRGSMLRSIGKDARLEIEAFLETKIYLDLWVKVLKNWRKDKDALRRLGYLLPKP